MRAVTRVTGVAAALRRDNLDTDVIIPMGPLMRVPRAELGPHAFSALRYDERGRERPEFVLNQEPFRRASVLICGRNLGSGSSREAAAHALHGQGIRAVVAPSFGDIFFSNCAKNGIVPVRVDTVDALMDAADAARGEAPFEVDVEARTITPPGGDAIAFDLDDGTRARLLAGTDEIDETLAHADAIDAFRARDRAARPWAWPVTA